MPDAALVAVAKAITAEIEAASWGVKFTLERSYADWNELLTELDSLRVDVVPATAKQVFLSRGSWEYVCAVDVCVRKKLGKYERDSSGKLKLDELDTLLLLTQRLGEYFAPATPSQTGRRLAGVPEAVWEPGSDETGGTDYRAFYVREHLREAGQYTGIVRITYRVPRGVGE